jgi:hypothetical protein
MLLNLGSLCILGSFSVLKGGVYQYFVVELLLQNPQRRVYALAYYISILGSIYASMILKSYLLTLMTMIIEIVVLLYFVCSSFPGGHTGLNYMGSMIWSAIKTCLRLK